MTQWCHYVNLTSGGANMTDNLKNLKKLTGDHLMRWYDTLVVLESKGELKTEDRETYEKVWEEVRRRANNA